MLKGHTFSTDLIHHGSHFGLLLNISYSSAHPPFTSLAGLTSDIAIYPNVLLL